MDIHDFSIKFSEHFGCFSNDVYLFIKEFNESETTIIPKIIRHYPKSVKNPKTRKEPTEPKKPPCAFLIFSSENRERVKLENPFAKFGEIAKILGAEWQKSSHAKRKIYEDKTEILKKEYSKKRAEYFKC